ncbi:MAG: response regulator [Acidobacteriota bacterium]|nr:response regulator [Acidobacteriota bacterium]
MTTETRRKQGFNNRILICDDNKSIHEDLFKIFHPPPRIANAQAIRELEARLFDDPREVATPDRVQLDFEIDSAFSGREALSMAREAQERGEPYAVIFMDVRMPPGPDGILTIREIWKELPATEVVVLTAHSDYSWDEMIDLLGSNDKLLYLNKPFSSISVKQVALNLVNKWNLSKELQERLKSLEEKVTD